MARGRPKAELMLNEAEQAQLTSIARSRSMSAALTHRAQIVLGCAAGESNRVLAQRMAITEATVGKWRRRFVQHRVEGLYDEVRPGRPRTIGEEQVAGLIRKTLRTKPRRRQYGGGKHLGLPLGDVVRMHVEALRQLGEHRLAFEGGQRHLRLNGRRVATSRSTGHFCSRFQVIPSPSRAEQSTYPAVQLPGAISLNSNTDQR